MPRSRKTLSPKDLAELFIAMMPAYEPGSPQFNAMAAACKVLAPSVGGESKSPRR